MLYIQHYIAERVKNYAMSLLKNIHFDTSSLRLFKYGLSLSRILHSSDTSIFSLF